MYQKFKFYFYREQVEYSCFNSNTLLIIFEKVQIITSNGNCLIHVFSIESMNSQIVQTVEAIFKFKYCSRDQK